MRNPLKDQWSWPEVIIFGTLLGLISSLLTHLLLS